MTSVDTQSTMALKALSPMPMKDTSLFPLENGDDDAMSDDSFHLHLSEDEEEEKTTENPKPDRLAPDLPAESEDEILNRVINKFDDTDGATPLEQVDEDELLNGDEPGSVKVDEKPVKDAATKEETTAVPSEAKPSSDSEEKDTKTDSAPVENIVNSEATEKKSADSEGDKTNDTTSADKEPCAESDTKKDETATCEGLQAEEDAAKQKQVNAEILKDQIMDTEDLLQIVDKETDENDKETDEIDKDSSSGTSPRSVDKGDSDEAMEGDETETEKMDVEGGETETKMDEEEEDAQTEKSIARDEDGVDIDESTLLKAESDTELDKVYKSLAASEDSDPDKEGAAVTDQAGDSNATETDGAAKVVDAPAKEVCANKEQEMETSTSDENAEKVEEKAATVETEDCRKETEPLSAENVAPEPEKEESSTEKLKADSDTDTSSKSSKRSLSDSEAPTSAKKIKLQAVEDTATPAEKPAEEAKAETKELAPEDEATPPLPPVKIIALNAIDEYMKIKTLKKLTYRDLEQIVLQKMCEAICHKSEIGELRHQLGVQEQMVEMWRKEVAQLTKQARDLEIVNKRLLHEVRLKNERDKPLIPVKITRSVGLQVRSDANMINNVIAPKRRVARPQVSNPQSTIAPAKQNRLNAANRANTINRVSVANKIITPNKVAATNRIVTPSKGLTPAKSLTPAKTLTPAKGLTPTKIITSPLKKVLSPKSQNTLLSKALQNSAAAATASAAPSAPGNVSSITAPTLTPIAIPTLTAITAPTSTSSTTTANKTATNVSAKSGKSVAELKTVIDLTDEDDKKSASTTPTQGVRIVSTPVKAVVTTAGVVNPPRIMYVYNNQLHQGVLATDPSKPGAQKLMLKLNSNVIGQANGVLTAVSNGSAIAVSNAAIRAGQVQPVRLASPLTPMRNNAMSGKSILRHPAPLPPPPANQLCLPSRKPVPPKPHLSIKRSNGGLILSWKMPYNLDNFEAIASYQLYAYQETSSPPSSEMWRKVGDVKALALPMACTLTQFADGNKYHFAVRAVDVQKRMGPFSDPEQILL